MNISGKSVLSLGACVAALTITLPGCSGNNDAPTTQASAPKLPSKPAPVQSPDSTTRDKNGDLVCKGGAFVTIEALDKQPAMDVPISDTETIDVVATPEGLKITGSPYALDWAAVSMIVNNAVGTNVPLAYGEENVPSDTILLTREGYGEARTFQLCGKSS